MSHKSQTIFFDWQSPWLPRLVDYLLTEWAEHQAAPREDLSKTVIIVPGGRAGRRLLELLALRAAEESLCLIPPRIVTLRESVSLLLPLEKELLPKAGKLTSRLAWREAIGQLAPEALQKIHTFPEDEGHYLVALAEQLAQELGNVGLDFNAVAARIGALHPEAADREEPRWQALAQLQQTYHQILHSWGFIDANEALKEHLSHGVVQQSLRVLVAGVVDAGPFFKTFFEKSNPSVVIIAPEEHAMGFDEQGQLITSYWLEHPMEIDDAQLIPCERSEDQADEVVKLVSAVSAENITIAVADTTTLPLLRDRLETASIPSRWAGGRPFCGGRLHQLLQVAADFVDHLPFQGPSLQATGALLRHPDISRHLSNAEDFIKKLDTLERDHLPSFLEEESLLLFKKNAELLPLLSQLQKIVGFSSAQISGLKPLAECVAEVRSFLLRLLGDRVVRSSDFEGHYLLGCLDKLLLLLEEMEQLSKSAKFLISASDFIKKLLEILGQETIPEQEKPEAIELLGWLELAADDNPCAIITSCHEGFLPRAQTKNPLLPESLRKAFGLADENSLLARDHYLLQLIMASRYVTIVAPRYNGRGEPARPSRLLMLGCSPETLPARVLLLTQRSSRGAKQPIATECESNFPARPVGDEMIESVTVTGLRTYLQSPRLFYFQHVLKLQELSEAPVEMHAGHFGTLIHSVLGAFGVEEKIAMSTDAEEIAAWLRKKLIKIAHRHFAPGPSFPITLQLEEAAQTLEGFAKAQAGYRREGWKIIAAENILQRHASPLEEKIILRDSRSMLLQGRIDRVDWHPEKRRWRIIDYKTSSHQEWKSATPDKEHFQQSGEEIIWKDLQLPLYLKLVRHWNVIKQSGLPLPEQENSDLCYFQLPIEPEKAGLSEPFSHAMITPAWHEANRLIAEILDGNFEEIGTIDAERNPTLAALCGI